MAKRAVGNPRERQDRSFVRSASGTASLGRDRDPVRNLSRYITIQISVLLQGFLRALKLSSPQLSVQRDRKDGLEALRIQDFDLLTESDACDE